MLDFVNEFRFKTITHFFISCYLLMKQYLLIMGMLICITCTSAQWKILIFECMIRYHIDNNSYLILNLSMTSK